MRLTIAITLATLVLTLTGSNGEEESPRELQFRPRQSRPGQRTQPPSRARPAPAPSQARPGQRTQPPSRARPGLGQPGVPSPAATAAPVNAPDTIIEFVVDNPDLTSLTAAVVRAGLVDALGSEGPFTLFAPNNEAIADIPTDVADLLFNDNNFIPQLIDLLRLHVIAGRFLAADLALSPLIFGLNGEQVFINSSPLTVDGTNVVNGDSIVSNGVVHVIDGVLAPTWVLNSLADRVSANADLSILFSLLAVAAIDLSGGFSALTIVGPTNDAFGLIDPAVVAFLTSPEGLADLTRILTYHLFFGILPSSILVDGFVSTLEGGLIEVITGPPLMFNEATVVELDILANNGVLFKINQVLDPDDSVQ
jgi:transforming growth factor-beta-induced protein